VADGPVTVEACDLQPGDRARQFAGHAPRRVVEVVYLPPRGRLDNGGAEIAWADGTTQIVGAASRFVVVAGPSAEPLDTRSP
jgi:hypothetical protein